MTRLHPDLYSWFRRRREVLTFDRFYQQTLRARSATHHQPLSVKSEQVHRSRSHTLLRLSEQTHLSSFRRRPSQNLPPKHHPFRKLLLMAGPTPAGPHLRPQEQNPVHRRLLRIRHRRPDQTPRPSPAWAKLSSLAWTFARRRHQQLEVKVQHRNLDPSRLARRQAPVIQTCTRLSKRTMIGPTFPTIFLCLPLPMTSVSLSRLLRLRSWQALPSQFRTPTSKGLLRWRWREVRRQLGPSRRNKTVPRQCSTTMLKCQRRHRHPCLGLSTRHRGTHPAWCGETRSRLLPPPSSLCASTRTSLRRRRSPVNNHHRLHGRPTPWWTNQRPPWSRTFAGEREALGAQWNKWHNPVKVNLRWWDPDRQQCSLVSRLPLKIEFDRLQMADALCRWMCSLQRLSRLRWNHVILKLNDFILKLNDVIFQSHIIGWTFFFSFNHIWRRHMPILKLCFHVAVINPPPLTHTIGLHIFLHLLKLQSQEILNILTLLTVHNVQSFHA